MNPKIQKLANDIEKTRAKITDMQARLRELERQKTEQENGEIIELVRNIDVSPQELTAMLRILRDDRLKEAMASQAPALPDDPDDKEDTDDEE